MGPLYGRNGGHKVPFSTTGILTCKNVISCLVKYPSPIAFQEASAMMGKKKVFLKGNIRYTNT